MMEIQEELVSLSLEQKKKLKALPDVQERSSREEL